MTVTRRVTESDSGRELMGFCAHDCRKLKSQCVYYAQHGMGLASLGRRTVWVSVGSSLRLYTSGEGSCRC